MPSRRELATRLEAVEDFREPASSLEQYLTPAEVVAHVVHLAGLQGDLEDRLVVDLGTGTGTFAIAAALAGADRVVGVDVDEGALELARANERRIREHRRSHGSDRTQRGATGSIDWVRADATRPALSVTDATVLSNPPFGAQRGNRHADRDFLDAASTIGRVSYTIHNEGSRSFVESFASDAGGTVTHAFRAAIPIDRRFAFHSADRREIEAEIFRVEWDGRSYE